MEKFILISLAVSLSVIFYVVTYFLISWQWPETFLSMFVCTIVLFLLIRERDQTYRVKPVNLISSPVSLSFACYTDWISITS